MKVIVSAVHSIVKRFVVEVPDDWQDTEVAHRMDGSTSALEYAEQLVWDADYNHSVDQLEIYSSFDDGLDHVQAIRRLED